MSRNCALDPQDVHITYDESTHPSHGWRAPEGAERTVPGIDHEALGDSYRPDTLYETCDWRSAGDCRFAGLEGLNIHDLIFLFGQPFRCTEEDLADSDGKITCWWNVSDLDAGATFAIRNYKTDPDTTTYWSIALVTWPDHADDRLIFNDNLQAVFGQHLTD